MIAAHIGRNFSSLRHIFERDTDLEAVHPALRGRFGSMGKNVLDNKRAIGLEWQEERHRRCTVVRQVSARERGSPAESPLPFSCLMNFPPEPHPRRADRAYLVYPRVKDDAGARYARKCPHSKCGNQGGTAMKPRPLQDGVFLLNRKRRSYSIKKAPRDAHSREAEVTAKAVALGPRVPQAEVFVLE